MPDFTVRPSMKLIRPVYWACFLLALVVLIYNQNSGTPYHWLLAFPLLLLVWAVVRHVKCHFTVLSLTGDKLRYECGWLSKSTRTIQISKAQDIRVDQTLMQRLLGIGNLSIETAGETSRLTVENLDHPQEVADQLVEDSDGGSGKKGKPKA
jgi:uncharacterized membrane protein YdbT with pleckstrin-like domain